MNTRFKKKNLGKKQRMKLKKAKRLNLSRTCKENVPQRNSESVQLVSASQSLQGTKENHTVKSNSSLRMSLEPRSSDNSEMKELLQQEKAKSELFNMMHSESLTISLPNRSWSIHYIEMPVRCFVICEMTIRFEIETGLIPIHTKQIVFDEKMNYELFLLNAKASTTDKLHVIETLTDLAHLITFVNNIKLCSGGPETILHANVNPECAYRDPQGKWRHNLCTLEVTDCDTCESCLSLIGLLHRISKRNKVSMKIRNSIDTAKKKHS